MNFAVLQFPGSNCDQDVVHVLRNVLGHSARLLWHKESSLGDASAIIIPGGFSYGDYLRTGAIARFSPQIIAITEPARDDDGTGIAKRSRPMAGPCWEFAMVSKSCVRRGCSPVR